MHSINIFNHQENFILESGHSLTGLHLRYSIFGKINADKSNVVWVVHALTANDNPIEWWPGVVGKGLAIDPDRHCIICVNNPGSPYGSIAPLSVDKKRGEPYYHDFPFFTTRDIARSFDLLRVHLGFNKVALLVGASMGGQIAMEWAIQSPSVFDQLILLATNAKHSPWGIAFNESQRLALLADPTYLEKRPDAGQAGLKAARSIALLSYRTSMGYNLTQLDNDDKLDGYKSASYQQYQGNKLVQRFDAFAYFTLTKTMDSHNVGRGRQSITQALSIIQAKTIVVGITTDLLFPVEEQQLLANNIDGARYIEIHSELGHDGFLTESAKVGAIISETLNQSKDNHATDGTGQEEKLAFS
jgi:homoserine O-acetyltransferase/O-succinyltransferase